MLAAAERRGIVLTYCSSVRERYRAVDWNCDLIITDYDLGRVTGIQLSNYLQNHLSHLPILIVSAYKQIDTRGWPPSVKGFLQKQIGPNAILDEAIRKR
jgi:DNA-binding NarL/FixJ family response regulator